MVAVTALGCPADMHLQRAMLASSSSISGSPLPMTVAPAARRMRKQVISAVGGRSVNAVSAPPAPFLNGAKHLEEWAPGSWKGFEALQQPNYPDQVRHSILENTLHISLPII